MFAQYFSISPFIPTRTLSPALEQMKINSNKCVSHVCICVYLPNKVLSVSSSFSLAT